MSVVSQSLVVVPTIGAKDVKAIGVIVNPDAMSKAIREGKMSDYAGRLSSAYNDQTMIQDAIERSKTVTGAYVWEAERLLNGGKVNGIGDVVADKLGRWVTPDKGGEPVWKPLSSGSVTRYGNIARLHFVFKFDPSDPQWSLLTSEFVSETSLSKILRDPKATKATVIAEHDRLLAAKTARIEAAKAKAIEDAAAKAKADAAKANGDTDPADNGAPVTIDNSSQSGTGATGDNTRGAAPSAGAKATTFKSNAERLTALETVRAALTPLSVDEFVALHEHMMAVAAILSGAPKATREAGMAKIEAAKTEA